MAHLSVGDHDSSPHVKLLFRSCDILLIFIVMCRARLGSKAPATARLEPAQALKYREPGLGTRLRLGSGSAQAQAGALCKKHLKFTVNSLFISLLDSPMLVSKLCLP